MKTFGLFEKEYLNSFLCEDRVGAFLMRSGLQSTTKLEIETHSFFLHKSIMMFAVYLAETDSGSQCRIGRVRGAELPQEYELMRFVAHVKQLDATWNSSTPACEWKDMTCEDGVHVTHIRWSYSNLSGSFNWDSLPRTLISFSVWTNKLEGSVHLDGLPPSLTHLHLPNNAFTGSLDLQSLPSMLIELFLGENEFVGSVDLDRLPMTLVKLSLWQNMLSGRIEFLRLPQALQFLNLSENNFSGPLDLDHLPPNMLKLLLQNNNFSGLVRFDRLPPRLQQLWLNNNSELHGDVNDSKLPTTIKQFRISGTDICGNDRVLWF